MTNRWKRWLAPGAVLTATAVLAACGSSSSSSGSTAASTSPGASSSSSSTSAASAGVAKAQQMVTQLESTTSTYPVPTASIKGVSALKGKTVYYIPLVQFIPGFVVTAATMKTALAKAGVNLQVCNGNGVPSTVASCVQQATGNLRPRLPTVTPHLGTLTQHFLRNRELFLHDRRRAFLAGQLE